MSVHAGSAAASHAPASKRVAPEQDLHLFINDVERSAKRILKSYARKQADQATRARVELQRQRRGASTSQRSAGKEDPPEWTASVPARAPSPIASPITAPRGRRTADLTIKSSGSVLETTLRSVPATPGQHSDFIHTMSYARLRPVESAGLLPPMIHGLTPRTPAVAFAARDERTRAPCARTLSPPVCSRARTCPRARRSPPLPRVAPFQPLQLGCIHSHH